MSTVTGSAFGDFKAYYAYSTSSTNTTYTIKVTNAGMYQSCTWSEFPWKTTMTATDYSSRSGTKSTTRLGKGYHSILTADKSYSYTRKASAYTVTIKATTKKNISGGSSGSVSKTFTIPALPTYTITYKLNGGTWSQSPVLKKTYGTAYTIHSVAPTRADEIDDDGVITKYVFLGWSGSNGTTYQPGQKYSTNAALTLTAIWGESGKYIISYDTIYNGATKLESQTKSAGVDLTLHSTMPTCYGYRFINWLGSDGVAYFPGDTYSNDAVLTLQAQYLPWSHIVDFDVNGGSGVPESFVKETDVDVVISDIQPTRQGYLFVKWNTKPDGSGVSYSPSGVYSATQDGGTVTLYAIWTSTDILMYTNGYCRALDFKEGTDCLSLVNDGTVQSVEFVETRDSGAFHLNDTAFYVTEILEQNS